MLNRVSSLIESLNSLEKLKPEIKHSFNVILNSIKSGGGIYSAGNGGSAACSSHLFTELLGKFQTERKPIKSQCLASNASLLTCVGNDFKFKNIFSRQIEGQCTKNDVLILFTTSGNSKNLLSAIDAALKSGTPIIVFNGKDGGEINKRYQNLVSQIIIDNKDGSIVQEIHLHLIHELVIFLEKNLYS